MNSNTKKTKVKQGKDRVRTPIGVKLIAIISIILMVALGGVTYAVSYFVTADVRTRTENEYQQQLSRLNEETLLRLRSSDDVAARESEFANKLEAAVKNDVANKAAKKLAEAEEAYKKTIAEADRKKANGVLTEEDYSPSFWQY